MNKIRAVCVGNSTVDNNPRYVIVNTETGELLDDCSGYGYKSEEKAWAGYKYKKIRFRKG